MAESVGGGTGSAGEVAASGEAAASDRAVAPDELDVSRRRLALLVKVAATGGRFSPKLAEAVDHATDAEVRVMTDLVDRDMSIPALVSFLQGAHTIVGDDDLYASWIFPSSRKRLSSHHRFIDKTRTPDYGYDGPLVREALHGKAEAGTWVQLERTKATFQVGHLPTWTDLVHLRDYVIYRVTGKNVGPWGLSAHVDTRPMILRPKGVTTGRGTIGGLAAFSRRRAQLAGSSDERSRWSDALTPDVAPVGPAGDLFTAPRPDHPIDLLPDRPYQSDLGLGLFGALPLVRARAPLRRAVQAILDAPRTGVALPLPVGDGEVVTVPMGERTLRVRATTLPAVRRRRTRLLGLEEEP